eukprot:754078-Ditylum_brightwellii.AAC.1
MKNNNINIPDNVILNFKQEYTKKRKLQPSLDVKEEHVGIATKLQFICNSHSNHSQVVAPEHSSSYGEKQDGKRSANKKLSWYSVNNKLVLSMMRNGGGASATATYLAFLELPCSDAMANKGFNSIQSEIGKEIKLMLEDKMKEWENQPHPKEKNHLHSMNMPLFLLTNACIL